MRPILIALMPVAYAIQVDFSSQSSIQSGLSTVARDLMQYYTGAEPGQIPGLLPGSLSCDPNADGTYCWWEAGAVWGALINYWQYTGDTTYNAYVSEALQFQSGPENNYNPPNQSRSMGVDDQVFWAFSALDAVEANFPEVEGSPSWLALAQGTYNFQKTLWDAATCGGGFRWQVYSFEASYNLKNTISNGGNFQLAARLAYITGNQSYIDWAEQVWDWMSESVLFQDQGGVLYIWDNTKVDNNCSDVTHYIWTYNYGTCLAGCAYMYNLTSSTDPAKAAVWQQRIDDILNGLFHLFFPAKYGGNIMFEYQCEEKLICDQDQKSFKAYVARWLAITTLLAPYTAAEIQPKLAANAQGAASQCDGGANGTQCGMQWWSTTYDGHTGVGEEMAALSAIGTMLLQPNMAPLSIRTGAKSQSNPDAGIGASTPGVNTSQITLKDKVGAAILTVLTSAIFIGGAWWLVN